MYIVRFVRWDDQPNEEYYYHHLEDAMFHLCLFKEDHSSLYKRIELLESGDKKYEETCILSRHDVKY